MATGGSVPGFGSSQRVVTRSTLSTSYFRLVDSNGQRYMPDFQAFEPALGEGSLNLSEGDTATGYIGFQVPDAVEASEVRFRASEAASPSSGRSKSPARHSATIPASEWTIHSPAGDRCGR